MRIYRTSLKHRFLFATLLLLLTVATEARADGEGYDWLPQEATGYVTDLSGVLSTTEADHLEQRLQAFSDTTSNQIVIVVSPTLGGQDEMLAATHIGELWGVGQEKEDNGVVILIKSKAYETDYGAVAIATGYGAEGVLPDAFCNRIIQEEMLHFLSEGEYAKALVAALNIIEPVLQKEYSFADYKRKSDRRTWVTLAILGIVAVVVIILLAKYANKKGGGGSYGSGRGGFFYFPGGTSGGSFSGGSFGGFGGGGFGGGSFGGFGGGSFGGGGSSGRF